MVKICNLCKNEYETNDKRQKYCGVDCSHRARKRNTVKVECDFCKMTVERYPSQILDKVFCSRDCSVAYNKKFNNKTLTCAICNKKFKRMHSAIKGRKHHYCSYDCADMGQSKNYRGGNHPNFTSIVVKCSQCSKEILRKACMVESHEDFYCSRKCRAKWNSLNYRGENNPRYNPNLTDEERENGRIIDGYDKWRIEVYRRDNFTCQLCGDNSGGNLNAHHLNAYAWDVENRTSVDNGITLCEDCHAEYHSIYGRGKNTKEEFEEYMKVRKEAL